MSMNMPMIFGLYVVGIIAMLYFITIRPARKKHRMMQDLHRSVRVGDRISTIGGIIGTVAKRDDDFIWLCVDDRTGTTIQLTIYAVQSMIQMGGTGQEPEERA